MDLNESVSTFDLNCALKPLVPRKCARNTGIITIMLYKSVRHK